MATLNTANVDEDFTMVAGGGRLSLTAAPGAWGDKVVVRVYWADAATATVFNALDGGGEFAAPAVRTVNLKAGDKLRVVADAPGGVPTTTSINATYLE